MTKSINYYFYVIVFNILFFSISANATYILHPSNCMVGQGGNPVQVTHYPTHLFDNASDGAGFTCGIPRLNTNINKLGDGLDIYIKSSPDETQEYQACTLYVGQDNGIVFSHITKLIQPTPPGTFSVISFDSSDLDSVQANTEHAVFGLHCSLPQKTSVYSIVVTTNG